MIEVSDFQSPFPGTRCRVPGEGRCVVLKTAA